MKKWALVIGVMLFFAVKICSYSMESTSKLEDDKDRSETSFSSFRAQEGLIGVPIRRIAAQKENQLLDFLQKAKFIIPSTLELPYNKGWRMKKELEAEWFVFGELKEPLVAHVNLQNYNYNTFMFTKSLDGHYDLYIRRVDDGTMVHVITGNMDVERVYKIVFE
ncbi:MAG: hypothetical protein ACPGWR_06875 [Ardenticatenaceae bacterium]